MDQKFTKILLFFTITVFLSGCVGQNFQEQKAKRLKSDPCAFTKNKLDKKICEADVQGGGDPTKSDGMLANLAEEFIEEFGGGTTGGSSIPINKHLWNGAITTLNPYSLKIADAFGGYIETDWIVKSSNINERCQIKVQVLSPEFISTGINATLNCQTKINNEWFNSDENLSEAETTLENKILANARQSYLKFSD